MPIDLSSLTSSLLSRLVREGKGSSCKVTIKLSDPLFQFPQFPFCLTLDRSLTLLDRSLKRFDRLFEPLQSLQRLPFSHIPFRPCRREFQRGFRVGKGGGVVGR